ncbi:uncharacterized protein LOC115394708 [Salarias fasciatus]|uniref:uncharacterized protein LOC115394708 n=1 Tax=Salarias fasciatus TaxID=181472 RepID=UPI0011769D01|nr:uncharacterized protein LOC115394708 [Salarias fasciatus]
MGFLFRWLLLSLLAVGRQHANAFSIRSAEEFRDEEVPAMGNQTEPLSSAAKNESSWSVEVYGSGDSPLDDNEQQEEDGDSQQQGLRPQPRCPPKVPCKSTVPNPRKCPSKLLLCSPRQLQEMEPHDCPPDLPNCDPEEMSDTESRRCPPDLLDCDPGKLPPHACLLKQPSRLKVARKPLCSPEHPLCPKRHGYPVKRQPYYVYTSKRPQQYVYPGKWRQPHAHLYRRPKRPKHHGYSIHWPKHHGYPNRAQHPSYQIAHGGR